MVGAPVFASVFSPFIAVPLAVLAIGALSGIASEVCLLDEEGLVLAISSEFADVRWESAGVGSTPRSLATLARATDDAAAAASRGPD